MTGQEICLLFCIFWAKSHNKFVVIGCFLGVMILNSLNKNQFKINKIKYKLPVTLYKQ